jgi:hypothetical protein
MIYKSRKVKLSACIVSAARLLLLAPKGARLTPPPSQEPIRDFLAKRPQLMRESRWMNEDA